MIGGVGEDVAEKFGRGLEFVAANADAHNLAILITHREIENLLRFLDSEVAGRIEDPEQRYAEIAGAAGASALQALEDGREIMLAEEADPDGDVDLRVQHVLFFEALHEPVGNEFVVVGASQVLADRLEGHEKTLEVRVGVEGLDVGEGGAFAMTRAEFEESSRIDGTLEVQVQLRLGELTDEGIGRTIRGSGHAHDCRFLTGDLRGRNDRLSLLSGT